MDEYWIWRWENEAHDFFGKGLTDWQKSVTGNKPSKDASKLKKQFDDYEHSVLSNVPKGGKRHTALANSLPKIKDGFLKQGHQFALDKLNERSRSVLDKGLQRLAKGALGANDEKGVQAHDDAAFDLINKYVLSEARFDEKDADAMYDKYLSYAGVDLEKVRASENEEVPGAKPGFKMENAEMYAENDAGTMSDAGGEKKAEDAELQIPEGQDEVYDGNQYREKVKQPGKDEPKEPQHKLGSLAAQHESSGKGPGIVSTGDGDPGGVSYGTYQMMSKDGGAVEKFVTSDDFPWKEDFKGLTPGSKEFTATWKEVVKENPEKFAELEHAFIKKTEYDPLVDKLKTDTGIEVTSMSVATQEVLWSTAVQHGKNTTVIRKAVKSMEKSGTYKPGSDGFEEAFINAIYDERATRCGTCGPNMKAGFRKRMKIERKQAVDLLKK